MTGKKAVKARQERRNAKEPKKDAIIVCERKIQAHNNGNLSHGLQKREREIKQTKDERKRKQQKSGKEWQGEKTEKERARVEKPSTSS